MKKERVARSWRGLGRRPPMPLESGLYMNLASFKKKVWLATSRLNFNHIHEGYRGGLILGGV